MPKPDSAQPPQAPDQAPAPAVTPEPDQVDDNATPAVTGEVDGDAEPNALPDDGAPQPTGGKTLTQEEFDRALAARLKSERQKFADYDELKAKAAELKALRDASKSEQELQAERLAELELRAAESERAAAEAALRLEAVTEATRLRFENPEDAVAFLKAGDYGDTPVAEALAQIAAERPYLIRRSPAVPPAANPSRGQNKAPDRTNDERYRDYFGGGAPDFWGE